MQGRLGSIYIARTRDMSENPQDSANVHREGCYLPSLPEMAVLRAHVTMRYQLLGVSSFYKKFRNRKNFL